MHRRSVGTCYAFTAMGCEETVFVQLLDNSITFVLLGGLNGLLP
jgi:hypothetical protein